MSYPPPQSGFVQPPIGGAPYPPNQSGGYAPYPPPGAYPPGGPQPGYYPPPPQGGDPAVMYNQAQNPQANWMPPPQVTNCPPGLEYLTQVDQLIVKQKVELLEALTTFETKNKYEIRNSMGQQVYQAKEDSDCLTRNCCGPLRPFDMKIMDNMKNEIIHLNRPLACMSCMCPCCLQSIEVSSPPGSVLGSVQQDWSLCSPVFSVKNSQGETVLTIEGPLCTYSICGDVEFKVMSGDGSTQVGKISKQWSGLLKETFTDADTFGISFPMDLDVRMKAVLVGAVFLIDFMFFEKAGNQEQDSVGML